MKLALHDMAIGSFAPMLESLSQWLDKAEAFAKDKKLDLVHARLAPDMYTLAQQVMLSCHHARDAAARLAGKKPAAMADPATSVAGMKKQIADTLKTIRKVQASALAGGETRDCSVPLPNDAEIGMDGIRFLRAWALPHFYFHVVTAYDILRQAGVTLGKQDYLSQVGAFIRPKK
jgi:hypothetical protein